jgi:tRNA threonylcarbamoyladenosine biosynthesis protein TsaE
LRIPCVLVYFISDNWCTAMIIYSNSEADTISAGHRLAEVLVPGDVVALYGELGAGKTSFVRGLSEGLGVLVRVSSPTFTIVNEYPGRIPLFHFDMYRLKNEDELFDIGWEDYLERGGVCAVEWSENVEKAFDGSVIRVLIEKTGDGSRRIDIIMREDRQ